MAVVLHVKFQSYPRHLRDDPPKSPNLLQWKRSSKPTAPTTQYLPPSPKVEQVARQVFNVVPPHAKGREGTPPLRGPLQEVTILETGRRRNSKPPVNHSSRPDRQRKRDEKLHRYDHLQNDENITIPAIAITAFDKFQEQLDRAEQLITKLKICLKLLNTTDISSLREDEAIKLLSEIQQVAGINPKKKFNFEHVLKTFAALVDSRVFALQQLNSSIRAKSITS